MIMGRTLNMLLWKKVNNNKTDKNIEIKDKIPRGAAELTTSPGCWVVLPETGILLSIYQERKNYQKRSLTFILMFSI